MTRAFGGIAVAVATVGLLVAGGTAAHADEPQPTPQPPITLTPEQSAWVCQERIPRLLERIARAQERIAAGADEPGSTADLQQRLQRARDAGRTARAERLQQRLDRRPGAVDRLAEVQRRTEAFRAEQCA